MRRMLDPKEVGGSFPSTITFDEEGNRTVGKNLGVDGKLKLKSLVSASNPDGDITKALGGGGGGESKIAVIGTSSDWVGDGPLPTAHWSTSSGRALKANTAYEVGDNVSVEFTKSFNTQHLEDGQIIIPCSSKTSLTDGNYKLQFGDVILVLTDSRINLMCSSNNNKDYSIKTTAYLTYTVVKAGTTGTDVSLPSRGWNCTYSYIIYTLGTSAA